MKQNKFKLSGLCFSPYIDLDPADNPNISPVRLKRLLQIIAPYTRSIRNYNVSQGIEKLPEIAKSMGFEVAAACWISGEYYDYKEVNTLKGLCKKGWVDLAIVGNNVLSQDRTNEDKLIEFIRKIKTTGVPTTTHDKWEELLAHPNVMKECDVIFAEFFPYLSGLSMEESIEYIDKNYKLVKKAAGKKEVIIGETGWLSKGEKVGKAIPSVENEVKYLSSFMKWADKNKVKYFYFMAFDEPWKSKYKLQHGSNWGIFDKDGKLKKGMSKILK